MGDVNSAEQQTGRRDRHPGPAMVVGIGASAGGIRALREFFQHVTPGTSIAYVVILHLSPDHDSKLAEVLQGTTALPVTQVREAVSLEGDHVYVIPPNQTLEVAGTTLRLSPMMRTEDRRAPVDMFFRTLAEAYGVRAAAVVLSGTGQNGSNGLKRVKEHAGLTIAQDPAEAEYADMPRNSIATGLVDCVLRVGDIPQRIVEYLGHVGDRPASISEPPVPPEGTEENLSQRRAAADWGEILTMLRVRTGQDFSNYKPATLRRRVERRLVLQGLRTLDEYLLLLREHPDEPVALMKDLLISVTSFFRDREAWSALERRVIPALFERKRAGDQVRVWSAGCATGEEAYSLAILLEEHATSLTEPPAIQVFATDLDAEAIVRAREGLYTEADVVDITPDRLQRFFQRETRGYRIRRELREMVLFAHHNVIRDPPFSHLDLVSCRNLLIYLNRPIQERLLETFHFALRPGGYLFVGTSEAADGDADLFVPVDKTAHIFESRTVMLRPSRPIADRAVPPPSTPFHQPEPRPVAERISPGDLHLSLLEQYAPPSLIVDEDHALLHSSPRAVRFLEMPPGEPSRDVLKLVVPELRDDLRMALHLAAQQRSTVEVGGLHLQRPDGNAAIRIVVKPALRPGDPPRGYFLVMFAADSGDGAPSGDAIDLRGSARRESTGLDDELTHARAQLRETVEQYETDSEESRAANEELQAMNEELRSAAEELETSREELQSLNEELMTVNQELKIKIDELGLTHNDFQNLINSTNIGTIFLDRALRVKLSTPAAQTIFNLLPSDIGRKLSDITSRLQYDRLAEDVGQVLDRLQTIEREVQSTDGRHYLMRILPYRTTDDRIDGVSITFHDISEWRQAESRVRASEERLRLLIERAMDYAIFTMTENGRVESWNPGAERMFGYSAQEIIGAEAAILFTPEDRAADVPARELGTAREKGRASDERWHLRKNGSRLYVSGVTTRLSDAHGGLGFAKIARDLTSNRQAEMDLQRAHVELEDRVAQRTSELRDEVTRRAATQDHIMNLLRELVTAQEDERGRIARDLHDQLGQQLTALRLTLERHRDLQAKDRNEDLARALALVSDIDRQIDFLAWELRPPFLDDLGLAAALPRYLEEWSAHHGVTAKFQTTGAVHRRLNQAAELTFYRIAQEALNNVIKHAHASRVDVIFEGRDDGVVLVVEDDGVGFDPAAMEARTGVGLMGMRERAALLGATLQVESSPGGGTTIYLQCAAQSGGVTPA